MLFYKLVVSVATCLALAWLQFHPLPEIFNAPPQAQQR